MRATLEQLRAMSDEELRLHWGQGAFPFELANCGACLTQHSYTYHVSCRNAQHEEFANRLKAVIGENAEILPCRAHLEELYALRLFYDSLYPPSEETPSPTEAIAEETASTEVGEKVGRENAGR